MLKCLQDVCAATVGDLAAQQYTQFYSEAERTLLTPEFLEAMAGTVFSVL